MKDSFASRLKYFRTAAGLTQQQLSTKSGVSRKQISDLEQEIQANPRDLTISKLADALNVDPSNLVPKSSFVSDTPDKDGLYEFKLNLNELPEAALETLQKMAESNNRSIDDELNHVVNRALTEAFERNARGEKTDFSELEKTVAHQKEKEFKQFLDNSGIKKAP